MARSSRPSSSRSTRPNQLLIAGVLVVIGAVIALGSERLTPGFGATPTPRPTATADLGSLPPADSSAPQDSAAPSDSAGPVDSAGPSASPVAPILDAQMPHSVNGTTLTIETDLGSTILGSDPGSRSFAAAVRSAGITPDKIEIGYAYDEAGSLPVTVLGFRVPNMAPSKLRPLVLSAWLDNIAPGVKTMQTTIAGVPVWKVSYGDEGADEYVYEHGDAVFIIETSDASLAEAVIKAMPAPGSGAPAASPAASPASS